MPASTASRSMRSRLPSRPSPSTDSSAGSRLACSSGTSRRILACRPFCADTGSTCVQRHAQQFGRALALALDLGIDLGRRAQRVPHGVDLVEHHDAGFARIAFGDQVLAPDREIGTGHARVGAEDEDHGMGLRNQAHRQLGLGADRVEAGGVEDDQPLLQQRVRHVEQRMAPARDFDLALGVGHGVVVGRRRRSRSPAPRASAMRHAPDLGHLVHGLRELLGVFDVDRDLGPVLGLVAPMRQRMRLEAGFDGQQAQAGRNGGVVAQLGRAHRRAACAGRHDAAAVAGEEDRVDQLRLAARELGDEGDHDLAGAHLRLEVAQALGHALVQQLVLIQPARQPFEAVREVASPGAMLVELLIEGTGQGRVRVAYKILAPTWRLRGSSLPGFQYFWHFGQK